MSGEEKLKTTIEKAKLLLNQDEVDENYKKSTEFEMPKVEPDLIKPQLDEKTGRYLAATQDLPAGTIISIKKPYVTASNSNRFWAYCSHCLTLMWTGIPCDQCRICMYCSEKCKKEAWEKYHDVECAILPHMQFKSAIYYYYVISIRSVIMGIKEMGSIEELKREIEKVEECKGIF